MGQASQQVELAVPPASLLCASLGQSHFLTGLDFFTEMWGGCSPPRGSEQRSGHPADSNNPLPRPAPPALPWALLQPQEGPGPSWEPLTAQQATPWAGLHGVKRKGEIPRCSTLAISTAPSPGSQLRRNRCDTVSLIWLFFLFQTRLTRVASHSGWWQVAWVYLGGTRGLAHGWVERGDSLRRTWLSSGKDGEGLRAPLPSTR